VLLQAKHKGPPPARSNMARKRPMSSPGNLGQKHGSMTTPARTQSRTRLVRQLRKSSPPIHKPTTYNQRVRSLNTTDNDLQQSSKLSSTDPKALMRLYGTRRVPGLYKPYEKLDPRTTKTYSERMKELQRPSEPARMRQVKYGDQYQDNEFEPRPSSAPSRYALR
jgi:hypothetical protein